jgi:zinc protease
MIGRVTKLALLSMAAAGAIAAALPAQAAQGQGASTARLSVPPLAYKSRKLKNGLTVYTLRDTTTPNVSVSVWYEVGAKHDPPAAPASRTCSSTSCLARR